jgi:hypothetical protein
MSDSITSSTSAQLRYEDFKKQLLSGTGQVLPPAPSSPSQELAHAISSLSLHPVLETALHLLNNDLPSAHFLARHMEASPLYESMFLHGLLHRIEGDYDNARAWYGDVADSDVFKHTWGGTDGRDKAFTFIRRIEIFRKETKPSERTEEEMRSLEDESKREFEAVLEFCETKFGKQKMDDASSVWVKDEKSSQKGSDMVIAGEGWRQF